MKVTHPDLSFTGPVVIGPLALDFRAGAASAEDISPALRSYLQVAGYTVTADPAPPRAYPEGPVTEGWSGKQLDAYASEHGIDLAGATRKADKVAAIGAAASTTVPDGSTGAVVDLATTPTADPA
ncbi:hypothetical protein [Cellulomonas olei]|uniref:hypothetical protein n=1 Tax=Cellulomonas sp. P4 TaxID=3142533 RepID=UPI0031BB02F4